MTWAFKRQVSYVFVLVIFILFFGYLLIRPSLTKMPTCFDNKQNGTELGVDCGGICARACVSQIEMPTVLWSRSFRVVSGRYNAIAYIENHNKNLAVKKINYRFRFADKNNVYIGKREGTTFIPPIGKFAVFEPAIGIGNSIPVYTTFEFTQIPEWIQVSQEKINQLRVFVSNIILKDFDTSPILTATIKNNSLFSIPEIGIVVILYDENHNAVSTSRTYLDLLSKQEEKDITFTWPDPIKEKIIVKEIIPMYNIFLAKLK